MIGAIDEATQKLKASHATAAPDPARRSRSMPAAPMTLEILLPFKVFASKTGVSRIVAETADGSFGLLPHRLDCVAALAPGILVYETRCRRRDPGWRSTRACW